jgi:hypothetical protein
MAIITNTVPTDMSTQDELLKAFVRNRIEARENAKTEFPS